MTQCCWQLGLKSCKMATTDTLFSFYPQIGTDAHFFAALSDALITRAQNAIQKWAAGRVITVNKAQFGKAEKVSEYDTRDVVMLRGQFRNIIWQAESC